MTQIANDTFQDTNGTELSLHTSDSGAHWAQAPGSGASMSIDFPLDPASPQVKGAYSTTDAATAEYLISRVPATADYTISMDIQHGQPGVGLIHIFDFPGIMFRSSSVADTTYRSYFNDPVGDGNVLIATDKVIAGSQSNIGSTATIAYSEGDVFRVTVAVSGSSISVTLLDVTSTATVSVNLSDSSITAIGQAGILMQHQSGFASPRDVITNFTLSEAGGPSVPEGDDTWPDMLGRPQSQSPTVTVFA